jgi:hypothetical protein
MFGGVTMKLQTLTTACLISIVLSSLSFGAWVPLTGSPVPISSLPAAGLEVGDKQFVDFDVFGIGVGGAIPPDADTLFVQGGQDDATGDYGLRFRLAWIAGSNQTINVTLSYRVSILPDGDPIKDVSMYLTAASATGTGVVSAGETLYNAPLPGGDVIASISTSKEFGDGGAYLSAYAEFDPVPDVWVNKAISVTGGTNGTASLSEVYQLYSQVPEPAAIALLGLGALALLRKRRA